MQNGCYQFYIGINKNATLECNLSLSNKFRGKFLLLLIKSIIAKNMHFQQSPKNRVYFTPHRPVLTNRIDSIITNDFNLLRKYQSENINHSDLEVRKNNPLILQYVHNIYDQYNIPNPLPQSQPQNYQAQYKTPIHQKSPGKKKFINLFSAKTQKYDSPIIKQKIRNELRQADKISNPDYQEENGIIQFDKTISKQRLRNDNSKHRVSFSYLHCNAIEKQSSGNQIAYSDRQQTGQLSVELNHFKDNDEFISPRLRNSKNSGTDRDTILRLPQLMTRKQIQSQLKGEKDKTENILVNESFRYCVGCEQALLKANINIHQQICKQFQQVFEMTPPEIIKYLSCKIHKFQDQIIEQSKELLDTDVQQLNSHSHKVMQESRSIVGNGVMTSIYESEYKQAMNIGQKWCRLTEQINKVNWFLKIRQRIRIQFKL